MRIVALRSFSRDIDDLPDTKLRARVKQTVLAMEAVSSIMDLRQVKKMKGHPQAYRVRIGSYRLGFFLEGDLITLVRFAMRVEIYKRFP